MADTPMTNLFAGKPLAERPLYQVEAVALTDPDAPAELARRYAADQQYKPKYQLRVVKAWLAGWHGAPDPYRQYRAGADNYSAPLRRAYRRGSNFRVTAEGWAKDPARKAALEAAK